MAVLLYDKNDLPFAQKLRDERFEWLIEMGANELGEIGANVEGFLFGYEHGLAALQKQVESHPNVRDRPEEREELCSLDRVLEYLADAAVEVSTPRTWIIRIDEEWPADLRFPLFVRTPKSSWKRGGHQGRVGNVKELEAETEMLRRAFGWDVPILAREWIDLAVAGEWMYGKVPQEVRVWIVDKVPVAWSFHYMHVVKQPKGFPPKNDDLNQIRDLACLVVAPFRSRLIAADFARDRAGSWHLIELGAGACCGTGHEAVFQFVAGRLIGATSTLENDQVGGRL